MAVVIRERTVNLTTFTGTWIPRFFREAELKATYSKDRSRKVGCVIVNHRNVMLTSGWNGFPRDVDDDVDERHERPAKYLWTEHAERNAIYNAASMGIPLMGSKAFVTLFPCADCMRALLQSGVIEIICPQPNWEDESYKESFAVAREMANEAEVTITWITEKEDDD